ncbi:hypothetical protein [Sphingobacterium rhinopitheci]|uniref:hypothetical protein n=1 Tax=Sphingobacterium rhinopitheci TaxID=2781960 RepID=UPI001F51AF6F|nr:hypothetical protein [Sphingobacterium rhinopitheci]MCI0922711.1 hypothetical protein [Sphingobacterium rhinopitheci]
MKITNITKYLVVATLFAGVVSCQNPLKDFNLQISTEVIKQKSTIRIVDIDGNVIPGATVALNSGETQNIYNASGTRDFKVVDGMVTFGLDPNIMVNGNTTVNFRVEVKAAGYNNQIVPVIISDANTGVQVVTLLKPSQLPVGAVEKQFSVNLSPDGATLETIALEMPSPFPGGKPLTITIPAGTKFSDAASNILSGGPLLINVIGFNPASNNIEDYLPGGSLSVDQAVVSDGTTAAGTFTTPLSIIKMDMIVNGTAVRSFSQPIVIGAPFAADYVDPATGNPIAAGQVFDIFSNSTSDNIWKFEQAVTVKGSTALGFSGDYAINHLSYFMSTKFAEACETGYRVNFSGDWMSNGTTYPLTVDVLYRGQLAYTRVYSITTDNATILLNNLPAQDVSIVVKDAKGAVILTTPLAACGQESNVVLPNPHPPTGAEFATLQLYVRCPNKTETITLLPTFHVYYKEAGSSAPYALLGEVTNGLLRTTLLKTDGTKYNFKAYYQDKVKEVLNKSINLDNTATVGIQPGDVIGEKIGATNLAILREACNKL